MIHSDAAAFLEKSAAYGPIGLAMVNLSNLEYAHDRFIFEVNRLYPELAEKMNKSFPRQYKDKIDFLVTCIIEIAHLRTVPVLSNGELNLQWVHYQLEELYQIRTTLAHGSVFLSETYPGGAIWKFDRFEQEKGSPRGVWTETSWKIGSGLLADATQTAQTLKYYLFNLFKTLGDPDYWERMYKNQRVLLKNRSTVGYLVELGDVGPEELLWFPTDGNWQ